jgi:hypothetical protein
MGDALRTFQLLLPGALGFLASLACAQETIRENPAERRLPRILFPQSPEAPSHPVVIRIHDTVFMRNAAGVLDTTRPVNKVVLGTPVTGTSRTVASYQITPTHDHGQASFVVRFYGQTNTRNVGRNGPAIIHSRTQTNFHVERHVTFHPFTGFQSSPTRIAASTGMVIDGVQSTKPCLRGAIVRCVASRRAAESAPLVTQIAARDTQNEILQIFNSRLDARIAQLNERVQIAREINRLFREEEREFDIVPRSTEHHVELAIGRRGAVGVFPPAETWGEMAAPVEVWVHQSSLLHRIPRLTKALQLIADPASPIAATLEMIQAIEWDPSDPTDGLQLSIRGDWLVVSFDARRLAERAEERARAERSTASMR